MRSESGRSSDRGHGSTFRFTVPLPTVPLPDNLRGAGVAVGLRLCAGDQDEDTLCSDAYVVTSMAGLLGFADLSRRCSEVASPPGNAAFGARLACARRAKRRAPAQLGRLLDMEAEARQVA